MTAYILQTLLLLGLSYFAGCFLACMIRARLVSPPATADLGAEPAAAPAGAVPRGAVSETPRTPVPPPPMINVPRQPAAEPMPAPVKEAFRRADTLEPQAKPAPARTPVPAAPPVANVPPPPAAAPAPVAAAATATAGGAATSRFEATLTSPPKSDAPVAPPPSSPAPPAAAAAAAAAVAAAVAAASQRPQAAAVAAPPAPAAAPHPTVRVAAPSAPMPAPAQPVAPAAATPAASPAPVAPAAPAAATTPADVKPDDLKRIRTIDALLETALNRHGVRRYSDIARWKPEDVARISDALGFKGRIEQENWIEQAQILARGEETFYSRRIARGEQPSARPISDEGERKPAAPTAAPAPAAPAAATDTQRARAGVEAAAAAAAALAAAAAASRQTAAPAAPAAAAPVMPAAAAPQPAPAAPSVPAPIAAQPKVVTPTVMAPAVEERAAFARPMQAPFPAPAAPAPAAAPAPVAPPPIAVARPIAPAQTVPPPAASVAPLPATPAVAAPARPPIGAGRDNLQRIGGINAELERLLNVQGITRYSQIAHWSKAEVERFDRLLGHPGRIQRENWIEQAQILAKGGDTAYSREHDRRTSEGVAREEAPRPARLADAIRGNDQRQPLEQRPRSSDLSSLRSVRSEAFRPSEAQGAAGGRPSDLKLIRGIGVLIEKKLNSMGITTFAQIANWSAADIERVSHVLDFKGRIERENWVEQARILAAGGQTELSSRASGEPDKR